MSPWHHGLLGYGQVAEHYRYEMPQMLKDLGYHTLGIGKMHWHPQNALHGFEATLLDESGRVESPYFMSDYRKWFNTQAFGLNPDSTGVEWNAHEAKAYALPEHLHPTVWTADRAVEAIRGYSSDQPLFLKISFARPHSPYDPPQRVVDKYAEREIPVPAVGEWCKDMPLDTHPENKPEAATGNFGSEYARNSRKYYYASITFIDEQIGRIIDELKRKGMYDNALICFVSDHGDMLGDHHLWRKTYAYEGSSAIPFIVKLPREMENGLKAEKVIEAPVELRDLLPTFLAINEEKIPEDMDGLSLLPLFHDKNAKWRKYIDIEHSTAYFADNYWCALTDGKIKYIWFFRTGKEHYVQTLAQNLALFAMAFYGKTIVYRTTDFKSNEYRNLLGGNLFEHHEDNPMLGYRGVSRNIHDWEIEAFKLARGVYGGSNLQMMLPFVRTLEEARSMRTYLSQVHKLTSGQDGLRIIQMSEIPSNAILAKQFIQEFDGFSIGSNDMTQMVLATDRDNACLSHIYDEEDPAVVWAILVSIFAGQKYRKKVGFCGQGVSNSVILRGLVAIAGIVSASVVPDTYFQTVLDIAAVEKENIPTAKLGTWLGEQHHKRLAALMEESGYGHILKKFTEPKDIQEWYEGELQRRHEQLREHLDTPKESFYRTELQTFRSTFHKPVIYATWDWNSTVEDALHQAGFANFEEQAAALEEYRTIKF